MGKYAAVNDARLTANILTSLKRTRRHREYALQQVKPLEDEVARLREFAAKDPESRPGQMCTEMADQIQGAIDKVRGYYATTEPAGAPDAPRG